MRRDEMLAGIAEVQGAFSETAVLEKMKRLFDTKKSEERDIGEARLLVFQRLREEFIRLSPSGQRILSFIPQERLNNVRFLMSIADSADDPRGAADLIRTDVQHGLRAVDTLRRLIERDVDLDEEADLATDTLLLTVPVGVDGIPVIAIAELLHAIDAVAKVVEAIHVIDRSPVMIVSLDSGSPFAFNLRADGRVVAELRRLITELTDRAIFLKSERRRHVVKTGREELGLIKEIGELERTGAITAEEANRMKRQVLQSSEVFNDLGVDLPEAERMPVLVEPLPLPRAPRLLGRGDTQTTDPNEPPETR